ncbi:MAG: polyhydroxyalkanoate depolymerase [Pseudomonadota bacterium]
MTVEDRQVLDSPFFVLRHFRKPGRSVQPAVLVVAPLSGHFGWILRDTVVGLLPRHDVALLEWKDARDIPRAAGRLDLEANIAAVLDAIHALGPGLTVMGVSQSAVPVLAATAVMAEAADPARPCALVLMGGHLDTRVKATAVGRLAKGLPPGWFRHAVARRAPGSGRPVYPARLHWQTLARHLARHLATGGELAEKLWRDDGADPDRFPFLRLYSTLMDLPAEFAEDTLRLVFHHPALARGHLRWHGRAVDPATIEDVALMTVEGGRDDSSGFGQTLVAHALAWRIPDALREHHIESGAGHFGLFHGDTWRTGVLPEVEDFIARTATACPVRLRRWRRLRGRR